jgi:16S rRNA processing protein RimM
VSAGDKKIIVGKINGVHGVKGWVKVFSETDPREGIIKYSPWFLKQQGVWREVKVECGRRQAKTVIAKLEGYDDRDQSMILNGAVIGIKPEQLGSLGQDEYYWRDLIGCHVVNQQGIELGTVNKLFETGANDVLVVKSDKDDREYLIPWTLDDAVVEVDLEQGLISVDWDENF